MHKKEGKSFYKKWWFWVILLAIMIVVGFTIIMVVALLLTTTGINKVAIDVQNIDNDATVYISAGENILLIEIPNYTDDTKNDRVEAIKMLLREYAIENRILNNYSKVIICKKINSDDNIENYFISTEVYSLPDMIQDINVGNVYIDFIEYTKKSLNTTSSTNNTNSTKGEDITLSAGKYVVGVDIKPGKYDAVAQSGSGNFFVRGSTSVNEILASDLAKNTNYGYIDKYSNVMLKTGDTVEIRSNLKVLLQAK